MKYALNFISTSHENTVEGGNPHVMAKLYRDRTKVSENIHSHPGQYTEGPSGFASFDEGLPASDRKQAQSMSKYFPETIFNVFRVLTKHISDMIKIKYIISRIILIILPLLYSANTFAQIKITVPVLTISDNRVEKILLKEFLEIGPHLKDHVIILDFDKSTSVLNVLYFNKKSFNELLMNEEGNFAGISNFKCLIGVKLGAKNFFKLSDPIKNESFCVTQNLEKNTELIKFVEPFDVYRTDYKISKDGFRLLKRNMKFDN